MAKLKQAHTVSIAATIQANSGRARKLLFFCGRFAVAESDIRPFAVGDGHGQSAGFLIYERGPCNHSVRIDALHDDRIFFRLRMAVRYGERIRFLAKLTPKAGSILPSCVDLSPQY
jgi:hypothetical protein